MDGQEASFAAILADKFQRFPTDVTNISGLSEMGKITLVGTKKNKDDIHWLVAIRVGIPRPIAKNANYAAIYGAQLPTLTRTIANGLSDYEKANAEPFAEKYLVEFKGKKEEETQVVVTKISENFSHKEEITNTIYTGGIASNLYNEMRNQILAFRGKPRNIFFGTQWPKSLQPSFSLKKHTDPSLCNYIIQAGCSTYGMLSATLCAVQYKIKQHGIRAIYVISIHDNQRICCV